MKRMYLYLANRSKSGMKLVTILQTSTTICSKLTDVKTLNLPQMWERKITQIIHENRMHFEPWVETASDFNQLKTKLAARGYTNLPATSSPLLSMQAYSSAPVAQPSIKTTQKVMLQKLKS